MATLPALEAARILKIVSDIEQFAMGLDPISAFQLFLAEVLKCASCRGQYLSNSLHVGAFVSGVAYYLRTGR